MFRFNGLSSTKRIFDPWATSILILALMTAAYQLVVTEWIDSLYIILTITFFGCVLGTTLGYSQFKNIFVFIFALLYGLFIVPWQLVISMGGGSPWLVRLLDVGSTLNIAFVDLLGKEPVHYYLFFLTLMSIIFWVLSVFAGYTLVRNRNPWLTILPMGGLTLIIYIYGSAASLNAGYLATYLFLALILIARIFINEKQTQWGQTLVQVPDLVSFDFMRVTLIITVILVFFAWQFPIVMGVLPPFQEAWSKMTRSWEAVNVYFENAFAAVKPSAQLVRGYYDDFHSLGRGNSRSEDLFLVVNAPIRPSGVARYYWRARSFDLYLDGVWHNSDTETRISTPQDLDWKVPTYTGRWNTEIQVTTKSLIATLYLPVETVWINHPNKVISINNPDGSLDILAIHADPQLQAGSTYKARSFLGNFTLEELRQAGTDYPAWVTDRYLQLPPTITPRTVELAEFITKGQENPRDMAAAITIWLRENIEYSYTVPRIPETQDPIDWFLFDLGRGFCNYYATAEVILLRALHIPARFSVGYAQGERVTEPMDGLESPADGRQLYRVLKKDAHSWPEVYFPGYGWVEFEPTVSQEPLVRPLNWESVRIPSAVGSSASSIGDLEFEVEFDKREFLLEREYERLRTQSGVSNPIPSRPFGFPGQLLLILIGIVGLFWALRARQRRGVPPLPVLVETGIQRLGLSTPVFIRRWARQASLQPLARAFHEVNLALKRVGSPALPTDTPMERGMKLIQFLPQATVPVHMLIREYQASVYSPIPGNWVLVMPSMRLIRRLSYLELLRRILPIKMPK
jgi:transglutaminase-like putative cysteine protease